MGLKEIKGDWREDDLAVLAMVAEREKSLYQLKNKADNNNRGQRGQSRGKGRNGGEREKRKNREQMTEHLSEPATHPF